MLKKLKKTIGKEILKWNPYVDKYIETTKLISDRLTYDELKIIENIEVIKKASERGFIAEPMENNKGYIFTYKKAYVSGEENKTLNEKFYNLVCKTDNILKKY